MGLNKYADSDKAFYISHQLTFAPLVNLWTIISKSPRRPLDLTGQYAGLCPYSPVFAEFVN